MRTIIVMGPPGSGKDTQIEMLKEYMHNDVISTGDITRELAKSNPKVAEILKSGGLLDDKLILKEIDKRLKNTDRGGSGIIFDGFPRTMVQAEELSKLLMSHDRTLDAVIYLQVSEEEVINRLSKRKVCSVCGFSCPANAEKCVKCGAELVTREDDDPIVIIKRMQTFLERTLPLVSYYRNKGNLLEINGEQTVEKVTEDIIDRLATWEKPVTN